MTGNIGFHYVNLPDDLSLELMKQGNRVIIAVNRKTYKRGLIPRGDGGYKLHFGLPMLKEMGLKLGDVMSGTIKPDPNPNVVELCAEFEQILEQDEQASDRFFSMTPGKQRGLAYYVGSAKRVETRLKRSVEIAHKLRTNTLYGDKKSRD